MGWTTSILGPGRMIVRSQTLRTVHRVKSFCDSLLRKRYCSIKYFLLNGAVSQSTLGDLLSKRNNL